MTKCESCKRDVVTRSAVVGDVYYRAICSGCLGQNHQTFSSNAQGYDRRRQYEDHAQDTLQPYDAKGPSVEFFRQYPEQSKKIFKPEVIEQLKRKI